MLSADPSVTACAPVLQRSRHRAAIGTQTAVNTVLGTKKVNLLAIRNALGTNIVKLSAARSRAR